MIIDPYITEAIVKRCKEEGVSHASKSIISFVERYLSDELPSNSIHGPLQDIYLQIKENN
jgi:hypothetical protein